MHPQRCASERSIKQVIFNLPNGFVGDDDADAIGDGSEESRIKLVDIRCNGLTHRPANLAQSSTPIGQRAGTIPRPHRARSSQIRISTSQFTKQSASELSFGTVKDTNYSNYSE